MFEVGIVAQFEAAHHLRGDFGPAARLHGHTYRVELVARGEQLRDDGTLFDVTVLQDAAGSVLAGWNYRNLDELPDFADRNTTVETVARTLFERVAPRLAGQGLASLVARVWESPVVYGAYEGDLSGP
ncbi:MAG TPA: 6-carboxytetrahydropterin synthase [Chloroflexota bacterium]|nr:6-carboxytetrahydropterin synthase [Chloroflexota bacterium]